MGPILGGGGSTSTGGRLHNNTLSSERFLDVFYSPPPPSTFSGVEFTEDDIFDSAGSSAPSTSISISHCTHQPNHDQKHFGILAALPATENRSVFNHKASASSTTASISPSSSSSTTPSSSSVMIPTSQNPRRPPTSERKAMKFLHHQSAPVNVPVLSAAMAKERRKKAWFDEISEGEEESEEVVSVRILPPHELVAAKETPELACSVLEGVGRTLKGRDLRRVRNAVFRSTGVLD